MTDVYPSAAADPLIRGDAWTVVVPFTVNGVVPADLAAWTWRAQIRPAPDAPVAATWTVETMTAADANMTPGEQTAAGIASNNLVLVMTLPGDQSAHVSDGDGFDLESLMPVARTWLSGLTLRVRRDFSHG